MDRVTQCRDTVLSFLSFSSSHGRIHDFNDRCCSPCVIKGDKNEWTGNGEASDMAAACINEYRLMKISLLLNIYVIRVITA